jgi:tRNA(Arg) A34 adenosine deaminase TadA
MDIPGSWKRGFDTAAAASEYSDGVRQGRKMGAALFSGSRLISIGANCYAKTDPISRNGETLFRVHAEMHSLSKRKFFVNNNLVMYVYRQVADKPACSIPCPMCESLMKIAGIKRVRCFNKFGKPVEIRI